MSELSDEQIIVAVLKGNDEAFTRLYQRHFPFLYKYLLKLTVQEDVSQDLAQETMLKAYLKLTTFKGDSLFSTWLISIASRLYLDLKRKQAKEKKKMKQMKELISRQLNWNADKHGVSWSEHFIEFNELEPQFKVPILLKHYYGYQYDEIAKLLQIKEGTVKSRVHHGLTKLRKDWREQDEEGR
ncbi:RNA polymerase sigma factor SigY [Alkalihalobacillus pseudalcaliphilus]|uniref:RNA polymerase sigma factor SigY n=1 Tax=Alkalihalobacillus pseudalcaliphilus TaxID=79884 RepID=UPI00064D8FDF|nr:RNA polymerase sigma factor SigY [Alkalihalobacillus pseudalcaliphilus]KMK75590.1 RNA polymerase sigma factor SigY [Alkalihalobacillus pseudalcaliphilus]